MIKKLFLEERFIIALILINALLVFVLGFDLPENRYQILNVADSCITALFVVEMVIKLSVYGKRYFDSHWNKFDFLLVVISLPALLVFIFDVPIQEYSFLLIFRVTRIFKALRFLKFVPGIEHLFKGIQRALKASIFVLIAFTVYIFIIGLFSFYLFKESAPESFGNPLISLYSTFKIFTIEGWFEIPEQVSEVFSPTATFFTYLYFIFVVISGGIIGLSLVNSVFVDAMVSDNNEALEAQMEELQAKMDRLLEHHEALKNKLEKPENRPM